MRTYARNSFRCQIIDKCKNQTFLFNIDWKRQYKSPQLSKLRQEEARIVLKILFLIFSNEMDPFPSYPNSDSKMLVDYIVRFLYKGRRESIVTS